jgi:CheY-like chemotaxis protein
MISTILIADDDKASCLILRKMVTDLGLCCDVVHDGVQAVEAVCGKKYDIVMLDLYMPVLSGIHAAIAIRSLRSPSPVIIGVSSSFDCKEASLCKDAGMAGILVKPFDRESIARLIQAFRPQPEPAAHEAKTQEDVPRNTIPEDRPDDSTDDRIQTRRSSSHQAPSCRAAIQRAINVSGNVRSLRSRRACIRLSAHPPACVGNLTQPSQDQPSSRRAARIRPAASPAPAPAIRATRPK